MICTGRTCRDPEPSCCVAIVLMTALLCCPKIILTIHNFPSVFQTGQQGPTVSTAVQVALVQLWLMVVAVFLVSVTAMVTLSEATVTTRQASVIALTIPKDPTVSPACLVIMETLGKEVFTVCNQHFSFMCELTEDNTNSRSGTL